MNLVEKLTIDGVTSLKLIFQRICLKPDKKYPTKSLLTNIKVNYDINDDR